MNSFPTRQDRTNLLIPALTCHSIPIRCGACFAAQFMITLTLRGGLMKHVVRALAFVALLPAGFVQAQTPAMSPAAALHQDMRKLWTDHVVWTRDYIVAAVGDQPDASAAAARLMKNQEDIGAAVAGYYGKAAGDQLTALLKQHISIAVDLIKAAKAGNKAEQSAQDAKWHQNGEEIATFLSKAN